MGIWGAELYQNDTSLDIKDKFEELFKNGKTAREITEKLIEDYKGIMGKPDEEPLFWYALADTQWDFGVLLPEVKEKTLRWIEKENCMLALQTFNAAAKKQRKSVLHDLQLKLLSPPSSTKRTVNRRLYVCQWKRGDVFAYRLESDLAKEKGLFGRYFLIQKVDECVWHPGHIVPIVYIKITSDTTLPANIEEYDRLEYVQTWFTKYEERFFPIDMSRPQEDIAQKSKIHYKTDEYGFLPQYRAILLNTSKRAIPKNLVFVGNYQGAKPPINEFIPHITSNIVSVAWKNAAGETFETKMIGRYCGHNLRELSIYHYQAEQQQN